MKILPSVVGGLGLLLLCLIAVGYYNFTHNFRIAVSPQQASDVQIALNEAMAEAVFKGGREKVLAVPAAELKCSDELWTLLSLGPSCRIGVATDSH